MFVFCSTGWEFSQLEMAGATSCQSAVWEWGVSWTMAHRASLPALMAMSCSLPLTVGAFPLSPAASVSMAATVSCCCLPPTGTVPFKPAARRGLALSKLSEAVVNREPGAVGNHTGPVLAPSVGGNHPQGTLIDLDNFMVLCGETQRWCTTPKKGNTQLLGNYIQNNMCLECMGSLCECLLH